MAEKKAQIFTIGGYNKNILSDPTCKHPLHPAENGWAEGVMLLAPEPLFEG